MDKVYIITNGEYLDIEFDLSIANAKLEYMIAQYQDDSFEILEEYIMGRTKMNLENSGN